jgi:site-specific recombinase XerD
MIVPAKYQWIVDSIAQRRPKEADQARLVICWLTSFLVGLGLLLEFADAKALNAFCQRASSRRNDVSMNRLVYTIKNVFAALLSHGWIERDPSHDLKWNCQNERRSTLDVDFEAIDRLLHYGRAGRRPHSEESLRNSLIVQFAAETGALCGELSELNRTDLGNGGAVLLARGTARERLARLSPDGREACAAYFGARRNLFGLGSEALFVGTTGTEDRLPLRSIANAIQSLIDEAGLADLISPSDIGRYAAGKLLAEGACPKDALLAVGFKRVPGRGRNSKLVDGDFGNFHPLHA